MELNPFVCVHFETSHDSQVKVEQQQYYFDHNLLTLNMDRSKFVIIGSDFRYLNCSL